MDFGVIRITFKCDENEDYKVLNMKSADEGCFDEGELADLSIPTDFDFGEFGLPKIPGYYCMDVSPDDEVAPETFYVISLWLLVTFSDLAS